MCIEQAFDGLPLDERRQLITVLMNKAKLLSYTDTNIVKPSLFHFAQQHTNIMNTVEGYMRSQRRWDHLIKYSIGDRYIGMCDVGDMFLHALDWSQTEYSQCIFDVSDDKGQFVQNVYREAKWELCNVSFVNHQGYIINTNLTDVFECDDKAFDEFLLVAGYPVLEVIN